MAPPKPSRRSASSSASRRRTRRCRWSRRSSATSCTSSGRQRAEAAALGRHERTPTAGERPYSEEIAQSQAELEAEEDKLATYIDELTKLGVELKGPDGLCDFPSLMDGREVYLCWRLGEPEVMHWHELNAGVAGRKPLTPYVAPRVGAGPRSH